MCYCHLIWVGVIFFFKQKTAYEMRISDWSSDVCSSDLNRGAEGDLRRSAAHQRLSLRSRTRLQFGPAQGLSRALRRTGPRAHAGAVPLERRLMQAGLLAHHAG